MAWLILLIAGLCEIGWSTGLKYTEGFTSLTPSILTVGTGYAVWTGIGAVGTAILGIFLFGESAGFMRLASIGLIVAGIVGLKLTSAV